MLVQPSLYQLKHLPSPGFLSLKTLCSQRSPLLKLQDQVDDHTLTQTWATPADWRTQGLQVTQWSGQVIASHTSVPEHSEISKALIIIEAQRLSFAKC